VPEKPKKYDPPSELMEQAFRLGIGGLRGDCELCGRHHFCTNSSYDYDEGELKNLQEATAREPNKYVEDGQSDGVSFGQIDGMQFVMGCDCNRLRRYEDWIWVNRVQIAEYLKARAEENLRNAQDEATVTREAHKALDQLFPNPRRIE
jgi:hypothetical protein